MRNISNTAGKCHATCENTEQVTPSHLLSMGLLIQ